jgi:hypothetical protein
MTVAELLRMSQADLDDLAKHNLNFKPVDVFNQSVLESRSELLFDLVRLIWA